MHELSVCQALVRQVEDIARQHDAGGVAMIRLRIGPLSGVEPQLLEQAYPFACAGTVAEHAALVIESLPVTVRCRECGAETPALPSRLLCGACGDWRTTVISGDELVLASVELCVTPAAAT
ncbi:MAG TPA: hydrogenase maturation nickel metallochaperone HypA [Burkholderiales bacterium]|nr:hydrogenase maturation nickel metallochaperone HypA [Burkholderiales bacterium]